MTPRQPATTQCESRPPIRTVRQARLASPILWLLRPRPRSQLLVMGRASRRIRASSRTLPAETARADPASDRASTDEADRRARRSRRVRWVRTRCWSQPRVSTASERRRRSTTTSTLRRRQPLSRSPSQGTPSSRVKTSPKSLPAEQAEARHLPPVRTKTGLEVARPSTPRRLASTHSP